MSGVGAEPSPPRLGPSSEANVMWPVPPRLTVASLRNGVTKLTSASNTISQVWILGSSPWGRVAMIAPSGKRFGVTTTSTSGTTQSLEDLHGPGWLRPPRIVRVGVDRADAALAINHEPGRDGQPPGAVTVATGQIDAELEVDLAEVVGEREDQAVLFGDLIAGVTQHLVCKRLRLLGLAWRALPLGRDDGEGGAGGGDLGQGLLQSFQLCVAVRSPAAAVERQHDGAAGQQLLEADRSATGVGQREVRRRLPDPGDPGHDPGGPEVVDAALHDRPGFGRDPRLGRLPHSVEFFLKRHRALRACDRPWGP